MIPKFARRADSNALAICKALRDIGADAFPIPSIEHSLPDLLVGYKGVTYLLEVKRPYGPRGGGGGILTPGQTKFIAAWRGGNVRVVHNVEDALFAIGAKISLDIPPPVG